MFSTLCLKMPMSTLHCSPLIFTGDRGIRDKDGYFYFVGRSDDVILSAGLVEKFIFIYFTSLTCRQILDHVQLILKSFVLPRFSHSTTNSLFSNAKITFFDLLDNS